MVEIRRYKVGDAEKIYTLFSENTPYKRDSSFWVWINRLLSDKESIIVVAEYNNCIIGHYAIIPQSCEVENSLVSCGLGIHAFVHPDYRDKVSIFSLTSEAYKIAESEGLYFVYGFPNVNYRLIQEKIERWKKVALFNAYEKNVVEIKKSTNYFKWQRISANDFKDFFLLNEIFEKQKLFSKIRIHSSLPFFINRYLYHPQNLYEVWILWDSNNIPKGVVVSKIFQESERVKAHIVDFILIEERLLEFMLKDFENNMENVDVICLWHRNSLFREVLEQNNYLPTGFDTFFGIKKLKEIDFLEKEEDLLNMENWDLPMGVSDAF